VKKETAWGGLWKFGFDEQKPTYLSYIVATAVEFDLLPFISKARISQQKLMDFRHGG